jgi:hypothetical protein
VTALASVADVNNRLDFDLDDAEKVAVSSALEDLSEEARFYSSEGSWEDPDTAPNLVKTIIVKAVARWARNMNGYVVSRAGDEAVGWAAAEAEAGSPSFSVREVKLLKAIGAGRRSTGAFGTISVSAFAPRCDTDIYISMSDGSRPIPWRDPCGW